MGIRWNPLRISGLVLSTLAYLGFTALLLAVGGVFDEPGKNLASTNTPPPAHTGPSTAQVGDAATQVTTHGRTTTTRYQASDSTCQPAAAPQPSAQPPTYPTWLCEATQPQKASS